jgi:ribosomal protein S12 methylthiotransferase
MIVGHPGETEEAFAELLDFVREARFERLGAFTYSEEEGTWGAEHLPDDVPEEVKQERLDALMEVQRGISFEYNRSRVGAELTVMVDDIVDGTAVCRSEYESPDVDGEILVGGAAGKVSVGDFVRVRVTGAEDYDLSAVLLS